MLLVVDNGSKYTEDLRKYLKKRGLKYKLAKKDSRLKTVMRHKYAGVILTGGPLLYDSKINIERVDIDIAVLLDLKVPILGICLGHQTMVEVFDGRIRRAKKRIEGLNKIKLIKKINLFNGLPNEFEVVESHLDCASVLPYNFECIAKSSLCHIEAIRHIRRPIYGVQFHPEASGEAGYKILDNFVKICNSRQK